MEHKNLKENEENLIEKSSLAIWLPIAVYKTKNMLKELGDFA